MEEIKAELRKLGFTRWQIRKAFKRKFCDFSYAQMCELERLGVGGF